jgi:hypothetical protein
MGQSNRGLRIRRENGAQMRTEIMVLPRPFPEGGVFPPEVSWWLSDLGKKKSKAKKKK